MNSIHSREDFTFTGIQSIRKKDHVRINKLIYKSVVNNEFVKKSKRLKTQFSVCYTLLVVLVPLLFMDNSHDKFVALAISFLTFLLVSWYYRGSIFAKMRIQGSYQDHHVLINNQGVSATSIEFSMEINWDNIHQILFTHAEIIFVSNSCYFLALKKDTVDGLPRLLEICKRFNQLKFQPN
ncbi:hypothetical protein SAMN05443246_5913 [Paenibacillus sp. GP183]|nr:hypothetical protein SAMN05443246_5913 [Paenibacillus sp. GP183]